MIGMRWVIISLILSSLAKMPFSAELAPGGSADAIRAVLDAHVAAWNQADLDRFMAGYAHSPDPMFVSGDEVTRGWQIVRDRYAKKYRGREEMGNLTFSELTIVPLCED